MLESQIESKVVQWAKKNGFLSLKLNGRGQVGWPDRMFIKNGRVCFIEFKQPGAQLRPMQIMRIRELAQKGNIGDIHIVNNVKGGIATLSYFDRRTKANKSFIARMLS